LENIVRRGFRRTKKFAKKNSRPKKRGMVRYILERPFGENQQQTAQKLAKGYSGGFGSGRKRAGKNVTENPSGNTGSKKNRKRGAQIFETSIGAQVDKVER